MTTVRPMSSGHITYGALLRAGIAMLSEAGVRNAENEAIWILEEALGTTRLALHLEGDQPVASEDRRRAQALMTRRASREPLQYLLGTQEFCGLEFAVEPAVLIPRPETELLVEEIIRHVSAATRATIRLADIGTGSGCMAITLARALPGAVVYATDCSEAALGMATKNAVRHGVADHVICLAGDLFEPLRRLGPEGKLAAIVSNPPYIPDDEWDDLPPEVRLFEPRMALAGGADGLTMHRRLLAESKEFLMPGGRLVLEVGQGQAAACLGMAEAAGGYGPARVIADGAGIERVVSLPYRG
ncbi:MAG TPA: peptide chain release factor N(5)-glutamine methyltransferase [Nitrospiraceae bacterium]|nr:peptide chain release factor N(5)-glutamine methyltransferase [Nitrospiraceae bacterium]